MKNKVPEKVSFWARFKGWSGHLRHFNFFNLKEAELKSCKRNIRSIEFASSPPSGALLKGIPTVCSTATQGEWEKLLNAPGIMMDGNRVLWQCQEISQLPDLQGQCLRFSPCMYCAFSRTTILKSMRARACPFLILLGPHLSFQEVNVGWSDHIEPWAVIIRNNAHHLRVQSQGCEANNIFCLLGGPLD